MPRPETPHHQSSCNASHLTRTNLVLGGIRHRLALVLGGDGPIGGSQLLLAQLGLLVLLNEIAKGAAARRGDVSDAVTLEVVLAADLSALHRLRDPVETDACRGKEEQALEMGTLDTP